MSEWVRRGQAAADLDINGRGQRHHDVRVGSEADVTATNANVRLVPVSDVVEQVVEQDLGRQHRQKWQEERRACHAEHVAEIRARTHQNVFGHILDCASALDDAVMHDTEIALEQHEIGGRFHVLRRRCPTKCARGEGCARGDLDTAANACVRRPKRVSKSRS